MNELNQSLPSMRLLEPEEIQEEPDSDAFNKSLDLRRYLTGKYGKSPENYPRKRREKRDDRKVYVLKRKHDNKESPSNKRSKSDFAPLAAPMYQHYQLLGDSQFVRFSEQLLSYSDCVSYTKDTKCRRIGYCVGGQKIKDLKERIESEEFPVYPYIIMLIGTNDIVHNTDLQDMCKNYKHILDILRKKCKHVVLLTVPPVARLEKSHRHWFILKSFNEFIQKASDGVQLVTVDLCSLFISYHNTISRDYYECFIHGSRPDLIHLNRKGFLLMKSILDIFFETRKGNVDQSKI